MEQEHKRVYHRGAEAKRLFRERIGYGQLYLPGDADVELLITDILRALHISERTNGYWYLRTAIQRGVRDPHALMHITKDIYPSAAIQYRTTASCVARSISHAIRNVWTDGEMELLAFLFRGTPRNAWGRPSPGVFIARISDTIRLLLSEADGKTDSRPAV